MAHGLEKFQIGTPLREVTNLNRSDSLATSEQSAWSPIPESPEMDRRIQKLDHIDQSPPNMRTLFSPKANTTTELDISNDISIIKPFNLSSQTDDDNDYSLLDPDDIETNDIENQSFRPVLEDSLDADPLVGSSCLNTLTSALVQQESPKLNKRKRKRAASQSTNNSPVHSLLESKKIRKEDIIKRRGRCRTIQVESIPMPSFNSPRTARERSASSLSIPSNNALLARSSSVTVNQIDNLLLDDNWSQKTVSPRQVADLVMSDGDLVIEGEKFAHIHIIDARYDYEFNGGHIKGAISIPRIDEDIWQRQIIDRFFGPGRVNTANTAVIFHCEFSINRGPNMRKWFREYDRRCNRYPELSYKKIFLLEGGFKRYYEEIDNSDAFEPSRNYVEETDSNHKDTNDKIIKFKTKAKRRNKKRPEPYEQSRTERRPGLRALLNVSVVNDSTPIRRSKRKT